MTTWDAIGYLASVLVLAAFCMKDMIPLRLVAVCSNVAFLIYGLALGLIPVWALHATLLPINGWRLWQGISQGWWSPAVPGYLSDGGGYESVVPTMGTESQR
ncbi:MAG TPA: hypothetical protein VEK73_11240 [Xanthobacteraceae bacterium]|nr:hypothetical protein [Xanthobacteraceae bacterium]